MSLRLRLLLATAVIALVALVGADVATYELLRSSLYRQVDSTLQTARKVVEPSIDPESAGGQGVPGAPAAGSTSPTAQRCQPFAGTPVATGGLPGGTVIEVRSPDGRTVYRCATSELGTQEAGYPTLPRRVTASGSPISEGDQAAVYFTAETGAGQEYRVLASVLTGGPAAGGQLIVAVPLGETLDVLETLRTLELIVTAVALAGVVGLGFWLVRVGLRPLREVERTAEAIAGGQLTERVPGEQARTEVGRLARVLNVMLGRIQQAIAERDETVEDLRTSEERMRQFVADASHELRTPLAAVTAYAELFDRGAADRPDDLRRVLHGIRSETSRMGRLVEDLLLLAHLDEGRPLVRERVDLGDLAADAVTAARVVGPDWPVELSVDGRVEAEVDGPRVRQVLDNLLANVRVHTPPGTAATVTVRTDDGEAVLEVADDGPGLDPADTRRIFERFFRVDPSRSRVHGGAGLGLAVVASIVESHGGRVTVGRSATGGARFTVHLPTRVRSAVPPPPTNAAGDRGALPGGTVDARAAEEAGPGAGGAIRGPRDDRAHPGSDGASERSGTPR